MNNKNYRNNKSNLRIAQDPRPLTTNYNNNDNTNNNNNNNNNNSGNSNFHTGTQPSSPINTPASPITPKFASFISSPSLDDTSHTILVASLHVKGSASSVSK